MDINFVMVFDHWCANLQDLNPRSSGHSCHVFQNKMETGVSLSEMSSKQK